jgi:hypothetical protein
MLLRLHPTSTHSVLLSRLMDHRQSFISASVDAYGSAPYPWQVDVGAELIRNAAFGACSPKLLIQPTGNGKSRVRDTVGIILMGISLTIIPLLSLGGDQFRKTIERCLHKNVTAFHLDELVKRPGQMQRLIAKIDSLSSECRGTIFLFCSPQLLSNHPDVFSFILRCNERNILRQIALDEIHLFVKFGGEFRDEFAELSKLFRHVNFTKTTFLLMTATCTASIVASLEALLGTTIKDHYWPDASGMRHRHVALSVHYSDRPSTLILNRLQAHMGQSADSKFILYSNRRSKVDALTKSLGSWLDKNDSLRHVDVVPLVGTLSKEQKAHHIDVFVRGSQAAAAFTPRFLCATSGAANAGIDSSEINVVYRIDFPPSYIDIQQEKGRAGRYDGASPTICSYELYVALEGFAHVYVRTKDPENKFVVPEYRSVALADLLITLEMLVIPTACLQQLLEHRLSNPATPTNMDPNDACACCSFCQGITLYPKMNRNGVCEIIFKLFISGQYEIRGTRFYPTVVAAIQTFPSSADLLFSSKAKTTAPKLAKQVILALIAAGILVVAIEKDLETLTASYQMTLALALHPPGGTQFAMHDDSFWAHLQLRD